MTVGICYTPDVNVYNNNNNNYNIIIIIIIIASYPNHEDINVSRQTLTLTLMPIPGYYTVVQSSSPKY